MLKRQRQKVLKGNETRSKTILQKGHVITIEPGIYLPGEYGCRIEDMICFRENGPEVITNCPKHLIEL